MEWWRGSPRAGQGGKRNGVGEPSVANGCIFPSRHGAAYHAVCPCLQHVNKMQRSRAIAGIRQNNDRTTPSHQQATHSIHKGEWPSNFKTDFAHLTTRLARTHLYIKDTAACSLFSPGGSALTLRLVLEQSLSPQSPVLTRRQASATDHNAKTDVWNREGTSNCCFIHSPYLTGVLVFVVKGSCPRKHIFT